jgi:predicted acyltransferase
VKRVWTPGWTLFSGGVCFLFLAAFSWIIEIRGHRRWAFPLVVIGMNSIAAYLIVNLLEDIGRSFYTTDTGTNEFKLFSGAVEPFFTGAVVLFVYWIILFWMYRRKLFLKI